MVLFPCLFKIQHTIERKASNVAQIIHKTRYSSLQKNVIFATKSLSKREKSNDSRKYTTNQYHSVYLAQILMNSSCQTYKKNEVKSFNSSYNSFDNIVAKKNKQHFIDMHLHFKNILQVLYLLCDVLHNQGTVYVVGYKADIFVANSFFNKKFYKNKALPISLKNAKIEIETDSVSISTKAKAISGKAEMLKKNSKDTSVITKQLQPFWEKQYQQINFENTCKNDVFATPCSPKLETKEENWCASSLSNWQEKSHTVWRIARFLIELQEFAIQNGHDFYQLRQKHSSLVSQIITVKNNLPDKSLRKKEHTVESGEQDFYLPFSCKPDLLILFEAESKRSVLKQAKNLQIPTIAIYQSKEIANEALYSLSGNHKSIHLLYRLLNSLSLLAKRT